MAKKDEEQQQVETTIFHCKCGNAYDTEQHSRCPRCDKRATEENRGEDIGGGQTDTYERKQ